ncbi:tyrosine-type recombinase/integrase [Shimia sp. R11_0]|uniref:tyrosine-type recombinase/integrase n=1 Tax=Shimia sp. R11_0 TaxID=2821096 RepID=UPI001AD9D534|nr:tyrosine-type recombinase/integrase [Shimia sp. R11_0]MBO9478241.1 tyrosine-type recombinase/integrase [Shimia sp. R11_0]
MTQLLLKADVVRDLPLAAKGQDFYLDTHTKGLGVRVGTRKKAYFFDGRVGAKKRRVTLGDTDALTLNEARKLAKKTAFEMLNGVDRNKEKAKERAATLTLGAALDLYEQAHDLKDKTAAENRRLITADFSDWMDKDVKGISPSMVERRFNEISERSPSIANNACYVLRAVLNHARIATKTDAGEYTLPLNPCQRLTDLKLWHKPNARTGRLTEKQFPAFFQALADAKNPKFADYMEILVRTGLRRTEASSLAWSDVNLIAKTFTITAEKSKSGTPLTLPMSAQTEAIFKRRMEAEPNAEHVFGDAKRYDPRKSLNALRKAVGIDLSYHDCRRTALSIAEQQEVPYGILKKMSNHSAGNDVTLKHYTNAVEHEALRPYVQRVSDQIDRLGGIDNMHLKIADQINRLNSVCDALADFDQFKFEIRNLQDVVKRLEQRNQPQ